MGDVIGFKKPDKFEEPDLIPMPKPRDVAMGKARCCACQHEWDAEEEVGEAMFLIECPACGLNRGQFILNCLVSNGDDVWTCGICKGQYYFIMRKPISKSVDICCVGCGNVQDFTNA